MRYVVEIETRVYAGRDMKPKFHSRTVIPALHRQDANFIADQLSGPNRIATVCIQAPTPRGLIRIPVDLIERYVEQLTNPSINDTTDDDWDDDNREAAE